MVMGKRYDQKRGGKVEKLHGEIQGGVEEKPQVHGKWRGVELMKLHYKELR